MVTAWARMPDTLKYVVTSNLGTTLTSVLGSIGRVTSTYILQCLI